MKPCPYGAIVGHKELATICDAVERAMEFVQIELNSDHVHATALRTPEYRLIERQRKHLLRQFERLHQDLKRLGADRPKIQLTEKGKEAVRLLRQGEAVR